MAKSQNSFNKKEREKKKLQKRKEKAEKKAQKKIEKSENPGSGSFEDDLVYVDSMGRLVSTPPDPDEKVEEIAAEDIVIGVPKSAPVDKDADKEGKVVFFNTDKGYGFIEEISTGAQFYVHVSSLTIEIRDNDKVLFKSEKGERGFNAVDVRKA